MSDTLRRHASRLPAQVRDELDAITAASRRLREEREAAFYGDEDTGAEAEALFSRQDAEDALATARQVLTPCTPTT